MKPNTLTMRSFITALILQSAAFHPESRGQVSFSGDVQPVFDANCVSRGCHPGGGAPFSLEASVSYENLVGVPAAITGCGAQFRVSPFEADSSVLYLRISGRTSCSRMPLSSIPGDTLSLGDQNTIRDWINEGALNDVTSVNDGNNEAPLRLSLYQNYPNPFNPGTTITFLVPESGEVSLKILNLLGEEVATLLSGHRDAGTHSIQWDAGGQPAGVYFYRLRAGDLVETRKLVLLR